MEWYKFDLKDVDCIKNLPKKNKYVLVEIKSDKPFSRNPIVLGYFKYHVNQPDFISIGIPGSDIIAWSDCLPDDFIWPKFEENSEFLKKVI